MHDGVDCRRLRARFEAYLTLHPEDEEARGIRAHLAACPACRAELGRWFILERWEEGGIAPSPAGAGLVRAVMERLGVEAAECLRNPGPRARDREKHRSGRRIFWNYLAAAFATLLLAFGGCFETMAGLALRTGRLQEGIRAIDRCTQRIVESGFKNPRDWWRLFESESNERGDEKR